MELRQSLEGERIMVELSFRSWEERVIWDGGLEVRGGLDIGM